MYRVFGNAGCVTESHPVCIMSLEPLTHREPHVTPPAAGY